MSAAIGSALAGARTITATSSQGLALMAEVVYIAAVDARADRDGGRQPRALRPINIHCDHSDSMLIRDSGVIQLFAENAQEAYDLMVMAPRLAEHPDVLLPVLVCQDGFTITHSAEPVALLEDDGRARLRRRLPSPESAARHRAPDDAGAVRDAGLLLRAAASAARGDAGGARRLRDARTASSRRLSGPAATARSSRTALDDAEHAIVCLGSTGGTVKDVVDELRLEGDAGRPARSPVVPAVSPRRACARCSRGVRAVAVLDRADSPGGAPPLFADVAAARDGAHCRAPELRLRARRPRPASGRHPRGLRRTSRAPVPQPERRAVSRLKMLARNENGTPPLRGGHALCQGCGVADGRPHAHRQHRDARSSSSARPAASKSRRRVSRLRPGTCRGCTSRSRTPRRSSSGVETAYRALARATGCRRTTSRRSSSSPATAARTTSASSRSPARSSAAIASSSSVTTTRPT